MSAGGAEISKTLGLGRGGKGERYVLMKRSFPLRSRSIIRCTCRK
jgi:hypothetical protein